MSKRDEYLAWCRAQVGVTEDPPGSNNVPYNTSYYGHPVNDKDAHWCATACWDGMRQVGCSELYYGGKRTASCPRLLDYYKDEHPEQIVTEPQPGDWVFFDWDKSGIPDHIGTVEEVHPDTLTTLEGNVNDGYRRLIRQRDAKILAYVRPKWPEEPAPEPEPEFVEPFTDVPKKAWFAKAVEWALGWAITAGLTAKSFGPNAGTTRAQTVQMLYKLDKVQVMRFDAVEKRLKKIEQRLDAIEKQLK